jgi:hypothetical protein
MALAKRNYVSGETVITAENLNEIQDAIIALEGTAGDDGTHPAYYIDLEGSYPNYTCPVAMADIKAAYEAGKVLKCRCRVGNITETLPLVTLLPFGVGWVFSTGGALSMLEQKPTLFTVAITGDGVLAEETEVVKQDNNLKFPNPNALTVKIGSTTVTYDGSSAQTVEIADGTEVSY